MYNNYGYNPYYQQQQRMQGIEQQQPMMTTYQQPIQLTKPSSLLGKVVDNIEVVRATDIPLDGSTSYFPLSDGSSIVTKQLQMDGTSKIVVFKPFNEQKSEVKYLTSEDLEKAINGLNLNEIDNIKEEIKEIKKQMKKKGE